MRVLVGRTRSTKEVNNYIKLPNTQREINCFKTWHHLLKWSKLPLPRFVSQFTGNLSPFFFHLQYNFLETLGNFLDYERAKAE